MRLLMLVALVLMLLPSAASARDGPENPVIVRPELTVPSDDCGDCVGASLTVAQTQPKNCADCGGVGVTVGAVHEDRQVTAEAKVCRGGFFYFCIVDEQVTLP